MATVSHSTMHSVHVCGDAGVNRCTARPVVNKCCVLRLPCLFLVQTCLGTQIRSAAWQWPPYSVRCHAVQVCVLGAVGSASGLGECLCAAGTATQSPKATFLRTYAVVSIARLSGCGHRARVSGRSDILLWASRAASQLRVRKLARRTPPVWT